MLRWILPAAGAAIAFAPALFAQNLSQPSLKAPTFAGREDMNGYKLKDYEEFLHEWRFVTVRYRKDTGEMRWTYANDVAWEALLAGKDYPDGSIFVKIGIGTLEDPDFVSSAVPAGAKRFQLMVKDSKKHADTDGWGYALFDATGVTFDEDPKKQADACHACHVLVRQRDYVFSQRASLDVRRNTVAPRTGASPGVTFVTVSASTLPEKVQGMLVGGISQVRMIEGPLRKHMFQGTIDEIRPTLTKEALGSGMPTLLLSEAGDRFSMVLPQSAEHHNCPELNGSKALALMAHYTIKPPGITESYPVHSMPICETIPK